MHQIRHIHHICLPQRDAGAVDALLSGALGLRRVKRTVDADQPQRQLLFHGTGCGAPGTLIATLSDPRAAPSSPRAARNRPPVIVALSIPPGAAPRWLMRQGQGDGAEGLFEAPCVWLAGPEGVDLVLVETTDDPRQPWECGGLPADMAVRGLSGVAIRLPDPAPLAGLLRFLGFADQQAADDRLTRLALPGTGPARQVTLIADAVAAPAGNHRLALCVDSRARLFEVIEALGDAGQDVSAPRDLGYFWQAGIALPGAPGIDIVTAGPGFCCDEAESDLGGCLKLPGRYEHLRGQLQRQFGLPVKKGRVP